VLTHASQPRVRLLAGRQGTRASTLRQAYVFARHDVVGLCAALASTGDGESWDAWGDLLGAWREAAGDDPPPASVLGEAMVFVAHAAPPATGQDREQEVAAAMARAGLGAWGPAVAIGDEARLWWWRDAAGRRVLVTLSPPEQEAAVSARFWWRGEDEAPDMMRYLVDAAKLEYEARVHAERRNVMARSIADIDAAMEDVLRLSVDVGPGRSWPAIEAAQERAIGARAASSALTIEVTYLQALHRTVGIARRNLAQLAPRPNSGSDAAPDTMFRRDQELGAWLQEQIDQDVGYAEAALARAREAQDLAGLRLQHQTTRVTRAQARVMLLQTSLTAALLTGIGIIALLQLRLEVWEPLRLPLLVVFTLSLLALPILSAHWYDRFRAVDHLVATLLGGAIGWTVAVALAGSAGVAVVVAGVLVGSVGGRAFTWLHDRVPGAAGG
jgi:hypothetical protein